jgi:ribosomal protein S18 acetylase RimI-like enzyme
MISKASKDDAASLEILINSAYRGESSKQGWTTEAHLLQDKRITKGELEELIDKEENSILKYTSDNTLIACVLLVNKGNTLYLGMLTVSPDLQNSGIGKKLLLEADSHAKTLGLPKITMTVISVREELIAWYKRHGYVDTGLREPFPLNGTSSIIGNEPLDFFVLEKVF